jgi:hypothetical protein
MEVRVWRGEAFGQQRKPSCRNEMLYKASLDSGAACMSLQNIVVLSAPIRWPPRLSEQALSLLTFCHEN